jgi:hypothetical protein
MPVGSAELDAMAPPLDIEKPVYRFRKVGADEWGRPPGRV